MHGVPKYESSFHEPMATKPQTRNGENSELEHIIKLLGENAETAGRWESPKTQGPSAWTPESRILLNRIHESSPECAHAHKSTHTHLQIHRYIHTHTFIYTFLCMYIHTDIFAHLQIHRHMMCLCTYIYNLSPHTYMWRESEKDPLQSV